MFTPCSSRSLTEQHFLLNWSLVLPGLNTAWKGELDFNHIEP